MSTTKPKQIVAAVTRGGPGGAATVAATGLALVERMAARGRDNATIAKSLRMSVETFRNVRKRQPEVQDALDRGRAALSDELTDILLRHARKGNVVAAIFLAKARCGWREGDAPEQRTNILIQLPDASTPQEYLRMIDARALPSPKENQQ
jgi:hypothetical protein